MHRMRVRSLLGEDSLHHDYGARALQPTLCNHRGYCGCVVLGRVRLSATLRTIVHQAPLSLEFSRQEHWNGLLFPVPGDLPDTGIEATSLAAPALAGRFFTTVPPGKTVTREATTIRNPSPATRALIMRQNVGKRHSTHYPLTTPTKHRKRRNWKKPLLLSMTRPKTVWSRSRVVQFQR